MSQPAESHPDESPESSPAEPPQTTPDQPVPNQPAPNQSGPAFSKVMPHDEQAKPLAQFVTTIRNPEQQVGQHIIAALQHDDTVAVLTTVALGSDGQQRIISAALNAERMRQVQELLSSAEEERDPEEPCVGFHCLIKPKAK